MVALGCESRSPSDEKKRLVRHAKRKAVDDAWAREAEMVRKGFRGRQQWTPEERRELMEKGSVTGYYGMSVHVTDLFTDLADDPTAVTFHRIEPGSQYRV
ncbi:UNVERIFIED_CONTAM: Ten-m [Trichonephila clavipes]